MKYSFILMFMSIFGVKSITLHSALKFDNVASSLLTYSIKTKHNYLVHLSNNTVNFLGEVRSYNINYIINN